MCRIPDTYTVFGTIRRFLRYPASGRIVKLRRVDLVKIKFTFLICVKKFEASLKTLLLFGLCTKSKTEFKPQTALVIFFLYQVDLNLAYKFCFSALQVLSSGKPLQWCSSKAVIDRHQTETV